MTTDQHFTRQALAARWNTSTRTIDRLRSAGKLPWLNLASAGGSKPLVRFTLADVENYEQAMRQSTGVKTQDSDAS
ncbi:MAG: hypothetical protein ACLP5H_19460 [Desulfomonilaceae bacterium]